MSTDTTVAYALSTFFGMVLIGWGAGAGVLLALRAAHQDAA